MGSIHYILDRLYKFTILVLINYKLSIIKRLTKNLRLANGFLKCIIDTYTVILNNLHENSIKKSTLLTPYLSNPLDEFQWVYHPLLTVIFSNQWHWVLDCWKRGDYTVEGHCHWLCQHSHSGRQIMISKFLFNRV